MKDTEIKAIFEETLAKHMADLEGKIDEKVKAQINELGLTKVDKTKFLITDNSPEARLERQGKCASFIKAVHAADKAKILEFGSKAMNEGTGSAGGYLVPEEFAAELNRIEEDYGIVRKFCLVRKMKSDTLNVPTLSTSVSVTWPGEAVAGTASTPVLANVPLLAKTMSGITVYSNEMLADADVSVVQELSDLFAEQLAGEEDKQGLNGTGSPFTGVLNDTNVNILTAASGHTAFSTTSLNDYRDAVALVKSSVLPTAMWIMHRTVWALIQEITENSQHVSVFQNPIVPMQGQGNDGAGNGFGLRPAGYLWGYPVYLNDQMPASSASAVSTKFAIFGSLRKGLFFGDRQQMTMKISEEGVVGGVSLFETNQSAVRVTERIALAVGLPKAFAIIKTAAS